MIFKWMKKRIVPGDWSQTCARFQKKMKMDSDEDDEEESDDEDEYVSSL